MDRIHAAAAGGFGAAAAEYERRRPGYPAEAVDRLIQELEIFPRARVLDLGAGTGKLTRMLVPSGARLVGLEPVEAMRRTFARVLPEVPVVGATAERLPFVDESFDAVVCAQSFHWFDGKRALTEIHRVLRPRGRLGFLWNTRDERTAWVRALSDVLDQYQAAVPKESTGEWRAAFAATGLFGTLHQRRFAHVQTLDGDGLVERYASASYIASLPEPAHRVALDRIRALAQSHPDLAGRHSFDLPYVTDLYWCAKS